MKWKHYIQGQIDDKRSELNEKGIKDADNLGDGIAAWFPEIAGIYSSDSTRCIQTAERIVLRIGTALEVKKMEELREVNHGKYDTMLGALRTKTAKEYFDFMLTTEEGRSELLAIAKEKFPMLSNEEAHRFLKWCFDPKVTIPLHETGREIEYAANPVHDVDPEVIYAMFLRAMEGISKIAESHEPGQTVLFISHNGLLKTIATEAETRQEGDVPTMLPSYYEPLLPGSKIASGTCSLMKFFYNKETKVLRFAGGIELAAKKV